MLKFIRVPLVLAIGAIVLMSGCSAPTPASTSTTTSAVEAPAVPPSSEAPAPVPPPQITSTQPAPATTQAASQPASSAAAAFGIGTSYSGKCTVAWPTAPVVTSTTIQMTMSCSGIPSQYLLVLVVYPDPSLKVTPSTGSMSVTGVVADFAQSQAGMTVPVIQASSITF